MNTAAYRAVPIRRDSIRIRSSYRQSAKRWGAALLASLAIGSVMAILGLVIGLFEALGLLAHKSDISAFGVVLLVLTFPTAMFAAHCLDKAYEAQKALREESCPTDL